MHLQPLVAAILIGLAATASAQVYSWKDASGRMHYSDQPPPQVEVKPIKGSQKAASPSGETTPSSNESAPLAASSAPAAKSWQEKDREFKERQAKQAEAAAKLQKEKADKDAKAQYCSELRRNQALVERGGRIGKPNDKGEVEALSDSQLKGEAEKLRERISKECSN